MNMLLKSSFRLVKSIALLWGGTILLTSCSSAESQSFKPIKVDGSETVSPIADAIAKEYNKTNQQNIKVEVGNTASIGGFGNSGTTAGFRKFCAGKTDINNASRPITKEEMSACNKAGIRYFELPIGFDALTITVNPQNTWAKDITIEELKKIWQPAAQGKITNWNQIRASYPNQPLRLFGASTNDGTYDFFNYVTIGKNPSRTDYVASVNYNILVQGVNQDRNALGYFPYAFYQTKQKQLKTLAVDSGKGGVLPSVEAVELGRYQPFSRPLFVYVNYKSVQDKAAVKVYVEYLLQNAGRVVENVGYIPLPEEGYHFVEVRFNEGKVGTVFEGKIQPNLTIGELLHKQATF